MKKRVITWSLLTVFIALLIFSFTFALDDTLTGNYVFRGIDKAVLARDVIVQPIAVRTAIQTSPALEKQDFFEGFKRSLDKNAFCNAALDYGQWYQETQINANKFKACYDPDGLNFELPSAVYYYNYTAPYNVDENYDLPVQSECLVAKDSCKGTYFLEEQKCDSALGRDSIDVDCRKELMNINAYCELGKCRIPSEAVLYPDLIVGDISEQATSNACINSYDFEICNIGEGVASEEFLINVSSNGMDFVFEYEINNWGALNAGECMLFSHPQYMNILRFGAGLGVEHDLNIELDSSNLVEELNEDNNQKTQTVYSGDAYQFDESLICDVTCYDSDGGKEYFNYGEMFFTFNDLPNTYKDGCWGENNVVLGERFCREIIVLPDGSFSNPYGQKSVDCDLLDSKCVDGACVPNDNKLNCVDYEGEPNLFFKYYIDYTDVDGNNEIIWDYCSDDKYLVEMGCEDDGEKKFSSNRNCYDYDMICQDGACVVPDEDLRECEQTDADTDPFVYGQVEEIGMLGEEYIHEDYCVDFGETVAQYYCGGPDGLEPEKNFIDCTALGSWCVNGKCVYPDPSLESCEENDAGLDFENRAWVSGTNQYGADFWNLDECVPGSSTLVEFYCMDNEVKLQNIDCSTLGLECHEGECRVNDPGQKSCEYESMSFNVGGEIEYHGSVAYVDEWGSTVFRDDSCVELDEEGNIDDWWDSKSDHVVQVNCSGVDFIYEVIDCTETGQICAEGKCRTPDPSLVSCEEEDKDITLVNEFGFTQHYHNRCDDGSAIGPELIIEDSHFIEYLTVLREYSCDETTKVTETIDCYAGGQLCSPFSLECEDYNFDLMGCEEFGDEGNDPFNKSYFIFTDMFGNQHSPYVEEDYYYEVANHKLTEKCIDPDRLMERYCDQEALYYNFRTKEKIIHCSDYAMVCSDGACVEA
jgi:hypothetical protein